MPLVSDEEVTVMQQAYPESENAVAFVEIFLCLQGQKPCLWDIIEKNPNATVDDVLLVIQTFLEDIVQKDPHPMSMEGLRQTAHPQFRKFLAAKLGMV